MFYKSKNLLSYLILVMALLLSACTPVAPGIAPIPAGIQSESGMENPAMDSEEITLFIAPEKVACVGVGPMECLQVKYSEDGESEFFYTGIDGFVFVPGYHYELRVLRSKVANPPADGSSLAYTLLEIVRQEPAYEGEALPLEGTHWTLIAFGTEDMVPFSPKQHTVDAQFVDGRMAGLNGCNNYSADYTVVDGKLQLGQAISTLMACPEPAMEVERAFMAALASASTFAIDGDLLTIVYAAGQLTFQGSAPAAADAGSIATISLPDGSECQFAGMGATLAFDDKRLNDTCGGGWAASQVTLERKDGGFAIAGREEVAIAAIQGAEMP